MGLFKIAGSRGVEPRDPQVVVVKPPEPRHGPERIYSWMRKDPPPKRSTRTKPWMGLRNNIV